MDGVHLLVPAQGVEMVGAGAGRSRIKGEELVAGAELVVTFVMASLVEGN